MRTKSILFGAIAAAVMLSLAGCYERFDLPGPPERYDDARFETEGYQIRTIEEIKSLFSSPAAELKYLNSEQIVAGGNPTDPNRYSYFLPIREKLAIRGKVISVDAYGNFYRGLFIQDETGGIEIKVGENGMYTRFKPGETVYVACDGLVLGNYRSMLSLGLEPMDEDISDNGTPYPNRFMEVPTIIDRHVKRGPATTLTEADTHVIPANERLTAARLYDLCGMLVRFEGMESAFEGYTDSYNVGYPEVFYKFEYNTYGTFNFVDLIAEWKAYRADPTGRPMPTYTHTNGKTYPKPEPENLYLADEAKDKPTWGFKQHDWNEQEEDEFGLAQDNYASAKFVNPNFVLGADSYQAPAIMLVRTSGYSRFALSPVLPHGRKADITGIVQRYTDGRGNNIAFQIAVNNVTDIVEVE